MVAAPVLFALFQAVLPNPIPEDSADALRRAARSAERQYESIIRRLAPVRHGGGGGDRCDEIVGRFCLIYDGGTPPPAAPPPPRVVRARQNVVEALRRAFAARPGELETAGPLLRYLIEDERAEEALSAARTFAWATGDTIWGLLLLGYAHHAAGEDSLAELRFDEALARMSAEERRGFEDIEVFLSGDERGVYRDLEPEPRTAYEAQFWILADPLYLLAGNERRAEHFARHVWSRLLSETPRVRGMHRWGRDLEELTLRYGVPTSRERILSWSLLAEESFVEHYHPEQLAYLPEALRTRGLPPTPPPGEESPLERERSRSGYAPRVIRRMIPLAHQLTRFPAGDSVALYIHGHLPLDSLATGHSTVDAALFLLDSRYARFREARTTARVERDTAGASFALRLPPGAYVYSLELFEPETRLAGRSRYALDVPGYPTDGVALSDPLFAAPYGRGSLPVGRDDPGLRPLAELTLGADDTVGLYAEAHGLEAGPDASTRYSVRLVLQRVDQPVLVVRALRWLGRQIGLSSESAAPELSWEGQGRADHPAILAVDVPLAELDPGLYELVLTVADQVGGSEYTSRRVFRISDSAK